MNANQALYQLSYTPKVNAKKSYHPTLRLSNDFENIVICRHAIEQTGQSARSAAERNPPQTGLYLMKFVRYFLSASGRSTPCDLPAAIHLSSHAILLARLRIVCIPSSSCATSSGVLPYTIFQ